MRQLGWVGPVVEGHAGDVPGAGRVRRKSWTFSVDRSRQVFQCQVPPMRVGDFGRTNRDFLGFRSSEGDLDKLSAKQRPNTPSREGADVRCLPSRIPRLRARPACPQPTSTLPLSSHLAPLQKSVLHGFRVCFRQYDATQVNSLAVSGKYVNFWVQVISQPD